MIIRKPYAFLIKNFKKIHIFLLLLCCYIYYKNMQTRSFVSEFVQLGTYDAYNEPITRMEVDEIRGVASSQMIRNLVAKDFIKEVGKKQTVGHPTLYGITDEFLNYFGLSSKEQLPKLEEIEESSSAEQDLYQSKYHEEPEIL